MNINTRFQVIISENGFQLLEQPKTLAKDGAISTLQNIEKVLEKRIPYLGTNTNPPFSALHDNQMRIRLGNIAHLIMEAYLEKVSKLFYEPETISLSSALVKRLCQQIDFKIKEAKEETLQAAQDLGYDNNHPKISKAYQYIKKFENEFTKANQQGFSTTTVEQPRSTSYKSLLKIANRNRESLLHFAAEFNLVRVIRFTFRNLNGRAEINRPFLRKTPIQVAEKQHHEKVIKLLLKNHADPEGVKIASYLPFDIWLVIFSQCSEKELGMLGRVSKQWRTLSSDDSLWEKFYLKRFPSPLLPDKKPLGFWKTKLKNFFENLRSGNYVETVLPYRKEDDEGGWNFYNMDAMLLGRRLFVLLDGVKNTTGQVLDIWEKQEDHSFKFKTMLNPPRGRKWKITENLYVNVTNSGNTVQLEEIDSLSPTKIAKWQLPIKIEHISPGKERIYLRTAGNDLFIIGGKDEKGEFRDPLQLPCRGIFRAALSNYLVLQDPNHLSIYKRDDFDNHVLQTILHEPFDRCPKIQFYSPKGSPLLLVKDSALPHHSRSLSIWELDASSHQWHETFNETGVTLLNTDGETFILGEYPMRVKTQPSSVIEEEGDPNDTETVVERTISIWKRTEDGYSYVCNLSPSLSLYYSGSEDLDPLDPALEKQWNEMYHTFAIMHGFVCVATRCGYKQFFFDSSHRTPQSVRIVKEDSFHIENPYYEDWTKKRGWNEGPSAVYQYHIAGIFKRTIPRLNHEFFKYIGFTQEGSLLSLEENRGIVIRTFTFSKNEILEDIAQGFFKCPSLTWFQHGEEILHLARLYHRFYRIEQDIKEKIYDQLAKIILSSTSLIDRDRTHLLEPHYANMRTRAEIAFFNGQYYNGEKYHYRRETGYSASKERIVQAIRSYINGNSTD